MKRTGRRQIKFLKAILILGLPILSAFALLNILVFAWEIASSRGWTLANWNWDSMLVPKLLTFQKDADRYSGIFLGGSGTHYHVIPSIIESEFAENKSTERVFNLAVTRASFGEAVVIFKSVLSMKPKSLDWIVLDTELHTELSPDKWDLNTDKTLAWHNFEETYFTVKYGFHREESLKTKIKDASLHIFQFLQHMTSLRTLSLKVLQFEPVPDAGFASMDNVSPFKVIEGSNSWLKRIMTKRTGRSPAGQTEILSSPSDASYRIFMLNRIISLAKDYNPRLKIIFYVPPTGRHNWTKSEAFRSEFAGYPLIDMNSPSDYPELFKLGVRFDPAHLKYSGAVKLSHLLGKRLAEVVRDEPARIGKTD